MITDLISHSSNFGREFCLTNPTVFAMLHMDIIILFFLSVKNIRFVSNHRRLQKENQLIIFLCRQTCLLNFSLTEYLSWQLKYICVLIHSPRNWPFNKVKGCLCMCVCLSVPKDLANHWTDMVILYSVAFQRSWEDL